MSEFLIHQPGCERGRVEENDYWLDNEAKWVRHAHCLDCGAFATTLFPNRELPTAQPPPDDSVTDQ